MDQVVKVSPLQIPDTTWTSPWETSSDFEGRKQEDYCQSSLQCKLYCDSTEAIFQPKWIYLLLPKCLWTELFLKFKNNWITH